MIPIACNHWFVWGKSRFRPRNVNFVNALATMHTRQLGPTGIVQEYHWTWLVGTAQRNPGNNCDKLGLPSMVQKHLWQAGFTQHRSETTLTSLAYPPCFRNSCYKLGFTQHDSETDVTSLGLPNMIQKQLLQAGFTQHDSETVVTAGFIQQG